MYPKGRLKNFAKEGNTLDSRGGQATTREKRKGEAKVKRVFDIVAFSSGQFHEIR